MKSAIHINSEQLNKEDILALLQAIRDCQKANFPDKVISVIIEVPELSTDVVKDIFTSIKPPFEYGPMIFK